MPYLKTKRKNKKPGEYKQKVSRRNRYTQALMKELDKQMMEAIARDK